MDVADVVGEKERRINKQQGSLSRSRDLFFWSQPYFPSNIFTSQRGTCDPFSITPWVSLPPTSLHPFIEYSTSTVYRIHETHERLHPLTTLSRLTHTFNLKAILKPSRLPYLSSSQNIYSNSIVAGGLLVVSYTTLATPLTSFAIRSLTLANQLIGASVKMLAVMKSVVCTALR